VGLPNDSTSDPTYNKYAYIGPDVTSWFSGISPTVSTEIELSATDRDAADAAKKAIEDLGFGYCLKQNPFILSGGEQVVAAIISATAGRPKRLAIDCALEQLSSDTRTRVLAYLYCLDGDLLIADNRTDEWHFGSSEKMQSIPGAPAIQPNEDLKISQEPCEIELIDLCHSYIKGRPVLKNLNLNLSGGTLNQLSGQNGVGKTTLSKILCGLIKPTSGEIRLNGKAVQPWKKPGMFVSYHFQNPDYQLFATSVEEQIAQSVQRDHILRWFGLEKHVHAHPLDLPFVLKKRVALATAINKKFGFLILDEPTLSQDKFSSKHILRLASSGGLIISHSRFIAKLPAIHLEKQ
jgi:energy-coupling factor transport system ATP-binding protein